MVAKLASTIMIKKKRDEDEGEPKEKNGRRKGKGDETEERRYPRSSRELFYHNL